ncbi:Protein of unknown function [Mesobacillus persicus]|uniref:DUF1878 family protein n=1 Tax=Mesobacillus persicus TaxID=930146 RepID=A0A1H8DXN5_9BACI|nr:DUF1878 family protein [Mesobacillus persicus]SEN11953.1 Protein of unknown function [Mesobacillus persicus]
MKNEEIAEKIKMLEFHQKLLLKMVEGSSLKFYYLIIDRSLTEVEVTEFLQYCENLTVEFKKQKAEGFVYFHPLFDEFQLFLQPKMDAEEVIFACLEQGLFVPLMQELKKYTKL